MASSQGKNRGPVKRRVAADRMRSVLPDMERLERRALMAGLASPTAPVPTSLAPLAIAAAASVAPQVSNVILSGRLVLIQFSEAIQPSTINTSTVQLINAGPGGSFGSPGSFNVLTNPLASLSYDVADKVAILDLRNVPQGVLSSGHYFLVVTPGVTDTSGNPLNGSFNGTFPSGISGGPASGTVFFDDLGNISLASQPPVVTSLTLDPASDSGLPNDNNTNVLQPVFHGTVQAAFPTQFANLLVAVQFAGPRGNVPDLTVGTGGIGFSGNPDFTVRTDANGNFTFQAPFPLPDGLQTVRVVVSGESTAPPNAGFSSQSDFSFRIDTTSPSVFSPSIPNGATVSSLRNLSLYVGDPITPSQPGNPLAVPTSLAYPALDPSTADNISNYQLINLGPSRTLSLGSPGSDNIDESSFITGANFVPTTNRVNTGDPFTGRIDLTFKPGLPSGLYELVAKAPGAFGTAPGLGLKDAAGNPLNQLPQLPGTHNFYTQIDLNNTAPFITNFTTYSQNLDGTVAGHGPRAYYEIPTPGVAPRADNAPFAFSIDFSGSIDPTTINSSTVELLRSADTPGALPDGDFGTGNGTGFSQVQGLTVTLTSSVPGSSFGQPGYNDRLIVGLPPGTSLGPDHYRIYLPNSGPLAIRDFYGQQLDGEFLGNLTGNGISYQDQLPTGQVRQGLSGDGVPGGAFETGFVVVPTGNILYTRPDYIVQANLPSTYSDGSLAHPFPTLAPQAAPNANNQFNANSPLNFGVNFDPTQDREQSGHFDPSAFIAAQQLVAANAGPVVIVALPAQFADPATGIKKSYVIALPPNTIPGTNTVLNGSASLPYNTTLVFQPGTTVRLFNASLLAQNQGTAIQALGTSNSPVTFTSLYDTTAGGPATPNEPRGGDWGGVVYRNFNQYGLPSNLALFNPASSVPGGVTSPPTPVTYSLRPDQFPVDGYLIGSGPFGFALSGADDAMSILDNATIRYGGGSVPRTQATGNDAVQLFNSRPAITNVIFEFNGTQGAQAAIGADFDSFREDDLARGPLFRNDTFINNSVNGVLLRAEPNGAVEATDAIHYASNPLADGGALNYAFASPVPYAVTSRFQVGTMYLEDSNNRDIAFGDRTYIQPGMIFKFNQGASLEVDPYGSSAALLTQQTLSATNGTTLQVGLIDRPVSLNIGDRTYISGFDANPNYAPRNLDGTVNPNFVAEPNNSPEVIFTSFFDAAATTTFTDPITGLITTIVPALDTANAGANVNVFQPVAGNVLPQARWGGLTVHSGVVAVVDHADFRFGGGVTNTVGGSFGTRSVFDLAGATSIRNLAIGVGNFFGTVIGGTGTHTLLTNNTFTDNTGPAIGTDPDGLFAADPLRPLTSGHPFFRGNVMQRNDVNGLEVFGAAGIGPGSLGNQDVSTVWDQTDLTYVLEGTINLAGAPLRTPSSVGFLPEQTPSTTLTIQSALPGTLLANGQSIASPGESTIVKLAAGANLNAGYDQGPANPDPWVNPDLGGWLTQIRILGIAGNESTNQSRVPAIITSLFDNTVGTTVNGVTMDQATPSTQAPKPGDGGTIYFGGNSLYAYNLFDPREGDRIDNADIRYLNQIVTQAGGVVDTAGGSLAQEITGESIAGSTLTQNNADRGYAITNSNLAFFNTAGVNQQGGHLSILHLVGSNFTGGFRAPNGNRVREGSVLLMINDSISNVPVGVRIDQNDPFSTTSDDAVLLNNTFANIANVGITATENGAPLPPSVSFLSMDNIFANVPTAQNYNGTRLTSFAAYDLFSNVTTQAAGPIDNFPGITGDPLFRNPAALDFNLNEFGPTGLPSAAIDAALSEFGPSGFGGLLTPIATQVLNPNNSSQLDPSGLSIRNNTNRNGTDLVALPGQAGRSFFDEFLPTLPGQTNAVPGPASNPATFDYSVATGQRDQNGLLRQDDPNVPNVGFGHEPFFDIGAFEFRPLFPPHVDNIVALTNSTVFPVVELYGVGSIVGTNQSPQSLLVQFDNKIDPNTINGQSVVLEASGGDGNFNSGNEVFYNLSGKLAFDTANNVLTINTSGLNLSSDEYRLILRGTGANVLRDLQGNALDGENLDPNNPNQNTNQRPLPSGNGVPGGDFQVTFTVDTHAPAVVPGSFVLSPASDSNHRDLITNVTLPTFTGRVTDVFPPANFLQNQTVALDISSQGDGNFDLLGVGFAKTDVNGNFTITDTVPLPPTPHNVGPDGIQGTADDTGYTIARVRVVNQAGNADSLNDPAAFTYFQVDTVPPQVTSSSPLPTAQVTPVNNTVNVVLDVSKNIDPTSLKATSFTLVGPAGTNPTIDPASLVNNITPLFTPQGAEAISFTIDGVTVNGAYSVSLATSGTSAVTDLAGNPLVANDTTTGKFVLPFLVLNSSLSHTYFVNANSTATTATGTIASPFKSIGAAMAIAIPGDTVAVLPGVYSEVVQLKSLVKLVSAGTTSTATQLAPGNPLQTVIRAPLRVTGTGANAVITGPSVSVVGVNLFSVPGFETEFSGFTVASPLLGNPATGSLQAGSIGLALANSDILVDRDYFIDNAYGVSVIPNSGGLANPTIENDVFAGNVIGLNVNATIETGPAQTIKFINNTVAFNTVGVNLVGGSNTPYTLDVFNNIFWDNDRPEAGGGFAIASNVPGVMDVAYNLFSNNNGGSGPANATVGVGGGINFNLGTVPVDRFANITGNPAFVNPVDPRPQFGLNGGPGNFFLGANFDLTVNSAAIDQALNAMAPTTDIEGRARIAIPGRARADSGPADIGAFEFHPAGTTGGTTTGVRNASVTAPPATGSSSSGNVATPSAATATVTSPTPKPVPTTPTPAANPIAMNTPAAGHDVPLLGKPSRGRSLLHVIRNRRKH